MESRERKFDVILLDVDGTLLDFGMSEKPVSYTHLDVYKRQSQRYRSDFVQAD